jgi:hypothetical protein
MTRKKRFAGAFFSPIFTAVLILMWCFTLPALGQVTFQTRYTALLAESSADLLEMERRLHFSTPVYASQYQVTTGEFAFHPAGCQNRCHPGPDRSPSQDPAFPTIPP